LVALVIMHGGAGVTYPT